jgi:hypothetical protein
LTVSFGGPLTSIGVRSEPFHQLSAGQVLTLKLVGKIHLGPCLSVLGWRSAPPEGERKCGSGALRGRQDNRSGRRAGATREHYVTLL